MASNDQRVLFASAARTATVNGDDQINTEAYSSAIISINATAITASPSVVFTVQGKDIYAGTYYTILASAAVTTAAASQLHIGTGLAAAANVAVGTRLPRVWRVIATHGDADSITYSVTADLLSE